MLFAARAYIVNRYTYFRRWNYHWPTSLYYRIFLQWQYYEFLAADDDLFDMSTHDISRAHIQQIDSDTIIDTSATLIDYTLAYAIIAICTEEGNGQAIMPSYLLLFQLSWRAWYFPRRFWPPPSSLVSSISIRYCLRRIFWKIAASSPLFNGK